MKELLDAARRADIAALRRLHAAGADLNGKWRGYRPLHSLIQEEPHQEGMTPSRGRLACLDWLLDHGADPELLGAWPPARAVLVAAFAGVPAFVERLAPARAHDVFVAAALGELRRVRTLIDRTPSLAIDRDAGGLTPLQCCAASRLGHHDPRVGRRLLDVATLLLDRGADPNARTRSWSHEADAAYFAAHDLAMFELLLARGADPTSALSTALWHQCYEQLGAAALRRGARVNDATSGGQPLLTNLVRWGRVEAALWLLRHGADPDIPDARGWTAVRQAKSRGNRRLYEALLAAAQRPSL